MSLTQATVSHTLSFATVLSRLESSSLVDGIALFGSRADNRDNPVSDYDVLLLVKHMPDPIFQMFTSIDGRMVDIIFVQIDMVDRLLTSRVAVAAHSFEGLFLQKMKIAEILYDPSRHLSRAKQHVLSQLAAGIDFQPVAESEKYAAWFWQNHSLAHIKRMMQAEDELYLTAVDMMLMGSLASICRDYCRVRDIHWKGQKHALRYLQQHDPDFLALLREAITASNRARRVTLYEQLVQRAIAPVGQLWQNGITAVYLRDTAQHPAKVAQALTFWENLLRLP